MKIESRLEKLEHEFKILKNEIQATLLEIQEHLLTQQYPSLRAEETEYSGATQEQMERNERASRTKGTSVPAGNPAQRIDTSLAAHANGNSYGNGNSNSNISHRRNTMPPARGGSQNFAATPAFTDLSFEDQFGDQYAEPFSDIFEDQLEEPQGENRYDDNWHEDDDYDLRSDAGISPHTREISLSDIKRNRREPGAAPERKPTEPKRAPAAAQRVNFAVLAEWVGRSVHTLGKDRTRSAIETYAASGYISPDVQKTVTQLLALSAEDEPAEPSGPTATIELLVKLDGILNGK